MKNFIACIFLLPILLTACNKATTEKHGNATVTKTKENTVITTDKSQIVIDNEELDEKRKQRIENQKKAGKVSAF